MSVASGWLADGDGYSAKAGRSARRRETEQNWTGGEMTTVAEELGRGWLFGGWAEEEKQWLARVYGDLESAT